MPDISMCDGFGCPKKDLCYRHTAIPSPFCQTYSQFRIDKDGRCEDYWPNREAEAIEITKKAKI